VKNDEGSKEGGREGGGREEEANQYHGITLFLEAFSFQYSSPRLRKMVYREIGNKNCIDNHL
jgi:hypothetical protein